MRIQKNHSRARFALLAAVATCALFFIPGANAAWLNTPYTPNTPGSQFDEPSVTILPDQSFGFIFNRIPSGGLNTIFQQTVSAAGAAVTPAAINEPDGGSDARIFAAPDGSQNLIYRTNNGSNGFSYLHISSAGAIGSTVPTNVNPGTTPISVADSNGTVTAAWPGASGGIDYIRISASGVGTAISTLQPTSPAIYPSLAADANGNTYFAWSELETGTNAIRVRVVKIDGAGAVSGPSTVATVGVGYSGGSITPIAASPDGDLLIGLRARISPAFMVNHYYPWTIRVRAGESTGVATELPGYPDSQFPQFFPTIGNGGRGAMFIAEYDPTTTHSFLIARPISGSGTAGAAIPISDDVGTAQFVVAAADAAGTATVAWTDDLETDTALVARLPFGATSVTPTPLFPGHETRSLQLATTKFGDVAITGTLDYYGATTSAGLQYWKNPPACEAASASTGFGASVGISLKCASRNTPSSFDIQTAPAHGTASVSAAGAASYTPAAGFSGTDSFTYTATNANGVSPGSTVTVDVAAAPVPPIVKIKKSAKFPKGKIKANRKIKVALTGVDPGKKITIAWRLKKKTAKGGAISTDRSYVTFKSPKKKGKYKVTIKLGSEVLFSGRVKVS